jgi:2-oxoisovalerate dehydrogenase E1 component
MIKRKLKCDFDWQQWKSTEKDTQLFDLHLASRILFDMFLINEFEHAVLKLKSEDCVWGPVHSSIGQESVAAAAISALRKSDKITGSHRAHHEFLCKTVHSILSPDWSPLKDSLPDVLEKLVLRTLAEIMGLEPGFCRGRGGSMHLRYYEAGILGTNAIVGGGIPIATGAAYSEKFHKTENVVVCFFGDGAINQGSFHEACNMAGLWKLPIIYFVENNLYAVGTHVKESTAVKDLAIRACSYDMEGRIVDGHDVIALYHSVKDVADRIRHGERPCIIEAKCYRKYHHAGDKPGSAYGYREKKEEEAWMGKDALVRFPQVLLENSFLTSRDIEIMREMSRELVSKAVNFCTQERTPRVIRSELWPSPDTACMGLYSDRSELDGLRYSKKEDFKDFQKISYSRAIAAVTGRWLEKDDKVIVFGEEVAKLGGGAYGATKDLYKKFPSRVVNTPISETGFIGLACGAALSGMRPIVEIMFPDFSLVAADQLFNQIGKLRYMYGGFVDLPIVVRTRIAIGCGYGAQHSMDPVGLFALFPGWRIVAPSNPFDYIGLFNTAMLLNDPVLFMEHNTLYRKKFMIPQNSLDYFIELGKANLVSLGKDVTVLAYSSMIGRLVAINKEFNKSGITADIIDLRSLDMPNIDYDCIGKSLEKTGAVVIVEEAPASMAIGPRIAGEIVRRFFDLLDDPPECITSMDVPNPVSRILEEEVLIKDHEILRKIEAVVQRKR